MSVTPAEHWVLVGPWYRWPRPGLPASGLNFAPVIQKFAGNDFMARFLARPQHSLAYDETIDVVQEHDFAPAGNWGGRLATFLKLDAFGKPLVDAQGKPRAPNAGEALFRPRPAPSRLRKLFQPTHDRHYLVTCELHCHESGFPRVDRRKVCQAAFVLRRRRALPGNATADEIATASAPVRKAQANLFELQRLQATARDMSLPAGERDRAAACMQHLASVASTTWDGLLARRQAELDQASAANETWKNQRGVRVVVEGWFPVADGARTQRGEWREIRTGALDADPGGLKGSGEQTYPLFALVPDPRLAEHDAAGRTLYYGVVPTQDLQHDLSGKPHFDDASTYELRCFVRRHEPCPGRAGKAPDCHGPLTWSASTTPFRVAAAFDVQGSSNRPVTIKLPDLRDLAAQAALRPRGRLSPVRFEQPQHLSPDGTLGGEAICSFSIPLITLVAMFVLNLFLPIVVFIFQLWFLLAFRFCIPPQVTVSAAIDADLAVTPPGVDLEADAEVKLAGLTDTAQQLRDALRPALKKRLAADLHVGGASPVDTSDPDLGGLDNNAMAPLDQSYSDAAALGATATPPEAGEPLVYEPHVNPLWPPRRPA